MNTEALIRKLAGFPAPTCDGGDKYLFNHELSPEGAQIIPKRRAYGQARYLFMRV